MPNLHKISLQQFPTVVADGDYVDFGLLGLFFVVDGLDDGEDLAVGQAGGVR